ncbi:MAG: hypothetical protein JNL28_17465 [Planctomycetes bacterium]|nr:hypothetical protein [Planctomycetota bacterium]
MRAHHRAQWAAACSWLAAAFDARSGEARERWTAWGGWSRPNFAASLRAAVALSAAPEFQSSSDSRARIVATQRTNGAWGESPLTEECDVEVTALAIQVLCALGDRTWTTPEFDAASRGARWLSTQAPFPAGLRALNLCSTRLQQGAFEDALRAGLNAIEAECEACSARASDSTEEAADRLQAWHCVANTFALDVRRHPAVARTTLELIQRSEASAGALPMVKTNEPLSTSARADNATLARASLALFAVADPVLGPRAAYAANLLVSEACSSLRPTHAGRGAHGGVRAHAGLFAPHSLRATALCAEALHEAIERSAAPWTLPGATSSAFDHPESGPVAHRA